MASSHSVNDPSISEDQTVPQTPPSFQQLFETNLNRELLVVSLEDESSLPPSNPSEAGTSSSHAVPTLERSLSIPSKAKSPASGFAYVPALEKFNITEDDWRRFSDDVRSHAKMTRKQWIETVGTATGTVFFSSLMLGFLSAVPGILVGQKVRNKKEKMNFRTAGQSGALIESIQTWNRDFFFSRGLAVRVDVPQSSADSADVDISEVKEYRVPSDLSSVSSPSGHDRSWIGKMSNRESEVEQRAARRGRIVLMQLGDTQQQRTKSS